jgi:GT2 family glycosyltransferase
MQNDQEKPISERLSILISILNWNKASETLRCIESLVSQDTAGLRVALRVIDNGSRPSEWKELGKELDARSIPFKRLEQNLGFAGGHNLSLREAIDANFDFVWLVNNDSTVLPDALQKLVDVMRQDAACGAVAPVSIAEHDPSHVDFYGARHDWHTLTSVRMSSMDETVASEQARSADMWVSGTAVLFRVSALKEVGVLDEKLFAYFEDNDISARLAHAGWKNRMVFDAKIVHACHDGSDTNRPPYFHYLMQRNSFMFWRKNTPKQYRKLLEWRLLDRSLYEVNKLYFDGFNKLGDAALLGVSDGFWGRSGAPSLERKPAYSIVFLKWLFNLQHVRALKRLQMKSNLKFT